MPAKPRKVKKTTALDLTTKKPSKIKTGREYRIVQEDTFGVHYKKPKKGEIKVE